MVEFERRLKAARHLLAAGGMTRHELLTILDGLIASADDAREFLGIHVKPWGLSQTNLCDGTLQVARCDVLKGGYSSVHKHNHKANVFVVHAGSVIIDSYGGEPSEPYVPITRKQLGPGQSLVVLPGEFHRFYALDNSILSEVYFCNDSTPVSWNDIERLTKNGCDGDSRANLGEVAN